jgi:rSAM/selenodomain-associated transferase 2
MPDSAAETLGVVIPALDADRTLRATLESIADGHVGFAQKLRVADVLVVDGGSSDDTVAIAQRYGARVISAPRGRGSQLAAGAAAVSGDWLLFLHADTELEGRWARAVRDFVHRPDALERAGYFRFALRDHHHAARRIELLTRWRCRLFGLPYGDQGLLISRAFYEALGGYPAVPLMEDVALVRRIGRRRLVALAGLARTSARRYREGGYWRRPLRNLFCLALYLLGVAPAKIRRIYG